MFSVVLGVYLGVGVTRSYGHSLFRFLRNFKVAVALIFLPTTHECSIFSTSLSRLGIVLSVCFSCF